jgi:hypothetical protein
MKLNRVEKIMKNNLYALKLEGERWKLYFG